ncbi:MAG: tetratricopeptide repeat protein [Treponema sp.]|nr:tetratricopeptide repeat protein [Treponema sp.]
MSRKLMVLGIVVLALIVCACSKQEPATNSGQPVTGSINVSSEAAVKLPDNEGEIIVAPVIVLQLEATQATEIIPVKAVESPKQELRITPQPATSTPKPTEPPKQKPNYAGAYSFRGNVYGDYDQAVGGYTYDRAIAEFTAVLKNNPVDADTLHNRGFSYAVKGDLDLAITDWSAELTIRENRHAFYNRGNAYGRKGNLDRAVTDFNEAIRIRPNDAMSLNNRGIAYAQKGEYDKAIADWEEVLQIDPNNADARRNIEMARQQRGNN